MSTKRSENLWPITRKTLSLTQLSELAGLSEPELHELIERGVFEPLDKTEKSWTFPIDCAVTARTAHRLRDALELDVNELTDALTHLEQIRLLEAEQQAIRANQVFY